uniref:C2H2-type domain-containing protein n=1 Tax=Meloidogyne incognita TaxID=6306 RepID=A0A914LUY0_MELIC
MKDEVVMCRVCRKVLHNNFVQHSYEHLEDCVWSCKLCDVGCNNRQVIVKHSIDFHGKKLAPIDSRCRFWDQMKENIKRCFPLNARYVPEGYKPRIEVVKQMQQMFYDYVRNYHITRAKKMGENGQGSRRKKVKSKKNLKVH